MFSIFFFLFLFCTFILKELNLFLLSTSSFVICILRHKRPCILYLFVLCLYPERPSSISSLYVLICTVYLKTQASMCSHFLFVLCLYLERPRLFLLSTVSFIAIILRQQPFYILFLMFPFIKMHIILKHNAKCFI